MEKAKLRTSLETLGDHIAGSPALLVQKKENLVRLLGEADGPEPEILANMYRLLIEENTSMTATVKPNFLGNQASSMTLKK